MPLPNIPIGVVLNMLKFFISPFMKLNRKKKLQGYYMVYHQNGTTPIINSPERIPNVLKMEINFWRPNVLNIKAKDFDSTYRQVWKTWEGTITMVDDMYGKGYYNYLENNEPGEHEIWCIEPETIRVRVIDKGRANLKERKDNVPSTQQWKKVSNNHPLIETFKTMLK
jgi:hypothetical protein